MKPRENNAAFTLAEALVSSSVLVLIMGVLLSMTHQTERLVTGTSAKIEQFQEARAAFEAVTRRLSQATLNTYLDYEYETVSQTVASRKVQVRYPVRHERRSELRFRSGQMSELNPGGGAAFQPTHGLFFQAPNGMTENSPLHGALDQLLNTWGYFVELNSDEAFLPGCLKGRVSSKMRFRLMEAAEPAERLRVYQFQQPRGTDWFRPLISGPQRSARPLAENIVALIALPRLSRADEEAQAHHGRSKLLAPSYRYDSTQSRADSLLNPKHQLPPMVQLVMVAIDEPSAARLERDYRNQSAQGVDYGKLFTDPGALEDNCGSGAPSDGDLDKFTTMLRERLHVSSRVFSTNVSIRGAKWSRTQDY